MLSHVLLLQSHLHCIFAFLFLLPLHFPIFEQASHYTLKRLVQHNKKASSSEIEAINATGKYFPLNNPLQNYTRSESTRGNRDDPLQSFELLSIRK